MLHYATIDSKTLELLKKLQQIKSLENYFLVGGTSLALQIGHRISIDINLFSYSEKNIDYIIEEIRPLGIIKIINKTNRILNLYINDIKVDFVNYFYDFLNPPLIKDKLKLASIEDIAAMKLSTVTSRGSKKDFIDLYYLLSNHLLSNHFSIKQIIDLYKSKYPDGLEFVLLKSLTYFKDAESDPMPKMMETINWESIKEKIKLEVDNYFKEKK